MRRGRPSALRQRSCGPQLRERSFGHPPFFTRPRLELARAAGLSKGARAKLAVFLASDGASYITGETIIADGGYVVG
jgi:NAD(P)-dependent dehydrogenase (short-subunit alcohol dehydrogenase family)